MQVDSGRFSTNERMPHITVDYGDVFKMQNEKDGSCCGDGCKHRSVLWRGRAEGLLWAGVIVTLWRGAMMFWQL